jgi:hypothetical protein
MENIYQVKLSWKSECYHTFWCKNYKNKENAEKKYREVLEDEYEKWYNKKPLKKLSNEKILNLIDDKISDADDYLDYHFEIECEPICFED